MFEISKRHAWLIADEGRKESWRIHQGRNDADAKAEQLCRCYNACAALAARACPCACKVRRDEEGGGGMGGMPRERESKQENG